MRKPKYTYKILKEDAEDFKDSEILKKGITATFTVRELERIEKEVRKQLKEAEAQYNLEAAKMENIERNHPYVKEMDEEKLFTIHMYQEAKTNYTKYRDFAKKVTVDLKVYENEMNDMYKQLGKVPSPYGGDLKGPAEEATA
jgi:hypothetical protein